MLNGFLSPNTKYHKNQQKGNIEKPIGKIAIRSFYKCPYLCKVKR